MIIEAVTYCVMWMNTQPSKNGVSTTFSPCEIMTNTGLDYSKHCKVPFGSYCQVFQENQPSNSDVERTVDAICLGWTGNAQGGYKILSLATRKKIVRNQFVALPMPKAIIEQVESIAERENLVFDDKDWTVIPGGIDARTNWLPHVAGVEHTPQFPQQHHFTHPPSVHLDGHKSGHDSISDLESGHADYTDSEGDVSQGEESYNEEIADAKEYVPEGDSDEENIPPLLDQNGDSSDNDSEDDDESGAEVDADSDVHDSGRENQNSRYNLRPREGHNYAYRFGFALIGSEQGRRSPGVLPRRAGVATRSTRRYGQAAQHLFTQESSENFDFHYANHMLAGELVYDAELDDVMPRVAHKVMVQLSLRQGLQQFGDCSQDAVSAELQQIHMKQTFHPNHFKELSGLQREKALESLILLEERRTGKIKGQMCADGRKQRDWTLKEDAASPTIMTDSILLTTATEAAEHRDVVVIDLPGAFLLADMDEEMSKLYMNIYHHRFSFVEIVECNKL